MNFNLSSSLNLFLRKCGYLHVVRVLSCDSCNKPIDQLFYFVKYFYIGHKLAYIQLSQENVTYDVVCYSHDNGVMSL